MRLARRILPLAVLAFLTLTLFVRVLFRGEQFAYRDAGHYYYPLHQRIQAQWSSGEWPPAWDPGQNAGSPLLGNPTAAVLYPGKLAFAMLPYPSAARAYVIGHVAIAFFAMLAFLRSIRMDTTARILGATSFAFGGPVLFQYCNVIYLVGASWLPPAMLGVDLWVRRSDPRGLPLLAGSLAMQILGGDLEIVYVTGLLAAIYAVGISRQQRVAGISWRRIVVGIGAGWIASVLFLAWLLPSLREWSLPGSVSNGLGTATPWVVLAILAYGAWRVGWRPDRRCGTRIGGLGGAGLLAIAVAGAQLLPVAEFASQTQRMSVGASLDNFGFDLPPYRFAELVWPGVFGVEFPENRLWLYAIPGNAAHGQWTASLSLGSITALLALSALRNPAVGPARWVLATLAAAAFALSLGRFGGPIWWARCVPGVDGWIGAHGPSGSTFFRPEDGAVRDQFGSLYALLGLAAPGFRGFRYPPKLLVFAAFATSTLAAMGWSHRPQRLAPGSRVLILAGLALLLLGIAGRPFLVGWWSRSARVASIAGPIDPEGAWREMIRGLVHGTVALAASWVVANAASRGRRWAGAAAVATLAVDLALAHHRLIWTVPQADFDREPAAARAIEGEGPTPRAGPRRVARMSEWHPVSWVRRRSADRLREIVAWERDTLQSGHGMVGGFSQVLAPSVFESASYVDLFQPWPIRLDGPAAASLGLRPGRPVLYYPRRAFDLWGSGHFLLPAVAADWMDPDRALASFLPNVKRRVPAPEEDPSPAASARWREDQDWQLLENRRGFPRAWVVRDVRLHPGLDGPEDPRFRSIKRSLLYAADPLWNIEGRPVEDPRKTAWVEQDVENEASPVMGPARGGDDADSVEVTVDAPSRVECEARLDRPGFVVLADPHDPGWSLSIDGRAAPMRKANLAMRGAFVPAGTHRLVFSYEPRTFRLGLGLSCVGLVILGAMAARTRNRTPE